MCGLAAYLGHKDRSKNLESPNEILTKQFEKQINRGRKGFGLIEVHKDRIKVKRAMEEGKAFTDLALADAPILLFHHRSPTSTDNVHAQTHPLKITHDELTYDWYVMHNGVISNAKELFDSHTKELGYAYTTLTKETTYHFEKFNDSEAFAIELVRYLEEITPEVGSHGPMAFIAINVEKKSGKPQTIFWGTNGKNPLMFDDFDTNDGLIIGSSLSWGYDMTKENGTSNCKKIEISQLFKPVPKGQKTLYAMLESLDIKFKEEPKPIVTTYRTDYTNGASYGKNNWKKQGKGNRNFNSTPRALWDDKEIIDISKLPEKKESTEGVVEDELLTPRQQAFETMAERRTDEIADLVHEFYGEIAEYDYNTDSSIDYLSDEITELLRDELTEVIDADVDSETEELGVRLFDFLKERIKELRKEELEGKLTNLQKEIKELLQNHMKNADKARDFHDRMEAITASETPLPTYDNEPEPDDEELYAQAMKDYKY